MSSILQAPALISPNQVPPLAALPHQITSRHLPSGSFLLPGLAASFPVSSQRGSVREKSHKRANFRFKPQTSKGKQHCRAILPHFPNNPAFSTSETARAFSLPFRNFQDLSLLCHPVLWLWSNASQIPATNPNTPGFQLTTWYLSTDLK